MTKKTYQMTIIPADESKPVTTTPWPNKPSYKDEQKAVGGLIQPVPHWTMYEKRRAEVYCNEEGAMMDLPINERATQMWRDVLKYPKDEQYKSIPAPGFWYVPTLRGDVCITQTAPKGDV